MRCVRLFLCQVFLWLLVALPLGASAAPVMVIDAGHGGHDRGGVPGQRASEKALTLSVSHKIASKLRAAGLRVVMTRTGDYFVGLRERCNVANKIGNAVFVSVHFNSAPRVGASGVETYYYSGKSKSLAAALHRAILGAVGTEDRGLRKRGFFVIRKTNCTSVLLESGFLTNPAEAKKLQSAGMQERLAGAIARTLISRYR